MPSKQTKEEIEAELAQHGKPNCCEACRLAEPLARSILDTCAEPKLAVHVAARVLGLTIGALVKPERIDAVLDISTLIAATFAIHADETGFR